jgi:ABC-2 type transport system ATP-binding protein
MSIRDTSVCSRLEVRGLSVTTKGRPVLRAVSLEVAAGEVVAVLGPNGSGKTTMLEAIAGLRGGAHGDIVVNGNVIDRFSDRARQLALMPDDCTFPEETTLGIALGLSPIDELVVRFGLSSLLGARATEISKGESKRAMLCATLKLGRPVLLLDEPFAAFDPRQLRTLVPLLRDVTQDVAVLVTIHQMRTAELIADRLLLLSSGKGIAFGTLEELRARADAPHASLDQIFLELLDREAQIGTL